MNSTRGPSDLEGVAKAAAAPPCAQSEPFAAALLSHIQETASRALVPLNVTLELTLACNIRCVHCYNFDRDATTADPRSPLTLQEILGVLRDVAAAGCLFLSLTGGEVLAHPDLFAILDETVRLNLSVQLLTNGTLLRPGVVGRLGRYRNLLGVSVSLYGASADVHDAVTQVPGSFRRTWDGITRLRAQGIAVRLKFIVMAQNAHEVDAMLADARAKHLPYMIDLAITRRHDGDAGSLASRVTPQQVEALYRGPLANVLPPAGADVAGEDWACNCARGNCAITATGDVQPCISVPLSAGNVRSQAFGTIWRDAPLFASIRNLTVADYSECAPCDAKAYCSRSRGAAVTVSGSYTGVDPGLCEVARVVRRVAHERG